jgi:hypothetical protein
MYVILTSKPGKFHTEVAESTTIVESYEYRFYGKVKAIFQIAQFEDVPSKIRIVEDDPPYVVNDVPSKFLEKFSSIEGARAELRHLTKFGGLDSTLVQCSNKQDAR